MPPSCARSRQVDHRFRRACGVASCSELTLAILRPGRPGNRASAKTRRSAANAGLIVGSERGRGAARPDGRHARRGSTPLGSDWTRPGRTDASPLRRGPGRRSTAAPPHGSGAVASTACDLVGGSIQEPEGLSDDSRDLRLRGTAINVGDRAKRQQSFVGKGDRVVCTVDGETPATRAVPPGGRPRVRQRSSQGAVPDQGAELVAGRASRLTESPGADGDHQDRNRALSARRPTPSRNRCHATRLRRSRCAEPPHRRRRERRRGGAHR